MAQTIHGTAARVTNRSLVSSAMLIGVVILGAAATSADDQPNKGGSRKSVAAKASGPSPIQEDTDNEVFVPPGRAFFVNSHVKGDDRAFQKEIVKVLCEKAESYPGREEHFSWLADDELYQRTVRKVYGLKGWILEAKELPGGGWLARVSVRPSVEAVGLVYIKDFILEDYRYQDGVLTMIQTDADVPKPDSHVFILH